jgi:hypothetical protein
MKILFSSLYQIDHASKSIINIDIAKESKDLHDYVDKLFSDILNNESSRKFQFHSTSTEVRSSIEKFLQNEFEEPSRVNAERLLRIELKTQEDIAKLSIEIQKGSLFQAVFQEGESIRILISKAEHSDFLDENDFRRHVGLPWEKKVFKAFIAETNEKREITSILVYDTNTTMAKYWWQDYLELSVIKSNEDNTRSAFEKIEKKILNPIKIDFPADYTILRNSSKGYFRSKDEFDINDYVSNVLSNYSPVNRDFPIEDIVNRTRLLPEKWDFDKRFTIVLREIDNKFIDRIKLTSEIDLVINGFVKNLQSVIVPATDPDGKKFIKIYSDDGFDRFQARN